MACAGRRVRQRGLPGRAPARPAGDDRLRAGSGGRLRRTIDARTNGISGSCTTGNRSSRQGGAAAEDAQASLEYERTRGASPDTPSTVTSSNATSTTSTRASRAVTRTRRSSSPGRIRRGARYDHRPVRALRPHAGAIHDDPSADGNSSSGRPSDGESGHGDPVQAHDAAESTTAHARHRPPRRHRRPRRPRRTVIADYADDDCDPDEERRRRGWRVPRRTGRTTRTSGCRTRQGRRRLGPALGLIAPVLSPFDATTPRTPLRQHAVPAQPARHRPRQPARRAHGAGPRFKLRRRSPARNLSRPCSRAAATAAHHDLAAPGTRPRERSIDGTDPTDIVAHLDDQDLEDLATLLFDRLQTRCAAISSSTASEPDSSPTFVRRLDRVLPVLPRQVALSEWHERVGRDGRDTERLDRLTSAPPTASRTRNPRSPA